MSLKFFNHPISVNPQEFLEAVRHEYIPNREMSIAANPRVPLDTRFKPSGEGKLCICSPTKQTVINIEGRWFNLVHADASLLNNLTKILVSQEAENLLIWSNVYGVGLKACTKVTVPYIMPYHLFKFDEDEGHGADLYYF